MKSPERGMHVYEIRPRGDKHGVDLISDVLHSIACGTACQRQSLMQSTTPSLTAGRMVVIHVYDAAGKLIERHEQAGDFRES
jgi:hypothetical protein